MEKKTIGKFMSALRRANGMTQKELGEKLFVSDKTVSRWECDECTPELSLIPALAEIFGITTDELLRGERNRCLHEAEDETVHSKQKQKSEKQFRSMLHGRMVKYQNLSLVAVGIALVGLITAMIYDLGFTKGLLGFCVGSIFLVVSVIFQLCAVSSKLLPLIEVDENQLLEMRKANAGIVKRAAAVVIFNVCLFAFLLPLGIFSSSAYVGVTNEAWFGCGSLCAGAALIISYAVYALGLREKLLTKENLYIEDAQKAWMQRDKTLLKKWLKTATVTAAVIGCAAGILYNLDIELFVKPVVFDAIPEFQVYMKENQNRHFSGTSDYMAENIIGEDADDIEEPWNPVYDREGNVKFTYAAGDFYYLIKMDGTDYVPIEIYLKEDRARALEVRNLVLAVLGAIAVVTYVGCILIYIKKTRENLTKNQSN